MKLVEFIPRSWVSDGGSERGNGADHGTLYAYMETSQ
jgi:hypothetical protein